MSSPKSTPNIVPEAGVPLTLFIILTCGFSLMRYFSNKSNTEPPNSSESIQPDTNQDQDILNAIIKTDSLVTTFIYVLVVVLTNFFLNVDISKSICKTYQWGSTFIITILSWGLIFIPLIIILKLFPGWLSPFSNSIGYLVCTFFGLNELINLIFKNPNETEESPNKPAENILNGLNQIYTNRSILINELTESNFEKFWNSFNNAGFFREEEIEKYKNGLAEDLNDKQIKPILLKEQLFNFIILKNTIAEFIWYLLTGLLITSITYNFIINNSCTHSAAEMAANYKKFEEQYHGTLSAKANKYKTKYTY